MENNNKNNIGNILSVIDGKNYSDLWENAFKQKIDIIEEDGKKTQIVVPTIHINLNCLKSDKK